MTTLNTMLGAPLAVRFEWKAINWKSVKDHVKRLQMRIAKAIKLMNIGKAKALQWILTHSFYAKLLAIKRVTSNKEPQVLMAFYGSPQNRKCKQ